MKISTEKENYVSREPLRCKLTVKDRPIEQMMEVEFLDVQTTSSGMSLHEAKEQIIMANGGLRQITKSNKPRKAGCVNYSALSK